MKLNGEDNTKTMKIYFSGLTWQLVWPNKKEGSMGPKNRRFIGSVNPPSQG